MTSTRYGVQYGALSQRLLLLGGDIELNPGPETTEDTKTILSAINDSNKQMTAELNAVRIEFRTELKGLKSELKGVKSKIEHIDRNAEVLNQRVSDLEMSFEQFEYRTDHFFSQFSKQSDADRDRIDLIERQLNQIESDKMKCSLRVFGLAEMESDTKSLTAVVDDEILSLVTSTNPDQEHINILSATRIGNKPTGKPRMVIVKFENFNDKLKLFSSRESLRAKGIRISNDLSYTQRQMIKSAYDQGFNAHFRNGKLIKEPILNNREHRRGVRTLDDRNRQYLRANNNSVDVLTECSETPNNNATSEPTA